MTQFETNLDLAACSTATARLALCERNETAFTSLVAEWRADMTRLMETIPGTDEHAAKLDREARLEALQADLRCLNRMTSVLVKTLR